MSTSNLINAVPVEVTLLDGKTETVQVARLSIRKLYQFANHLAGNEGPELAMLCTGRDGAWIDTLTPASFGALHRACIDANFTAASEVAKGDPRLAAKLMPFVQDNATLLILSLGAMSGLNLSDSPSAPPPPGSVAETTSDASTSPPSASAASSAPANT